MLITYPSAHKWVELVGAQPDSGLGKNNQARIRSTLKRIPETEISFNIEPLSEETLEWFMPLYTASIAQKHNPKIFDIRGTTIGKSSQYPYFALALYEAGHPIGATIFSERRSLISIAYRIYPLDWSQHKLQANPSLYSEYLLNEYAWKHGFIKISHGKDRNPYGLNAHIGLGIFKLSVGCTPYLPTTSYEMLTLDLTAIDTDVLIMLPPETGAQITNALLYTKEEHFNRYSQITKYPERLSVEVKFRPTT